MDNKRVAEIILIASLVCFCVTHYFSGTNFIVDIAHAGFAAALVGGLADWFAITAFFQKVFIFPHTDIIRNEREDLIQSIADFFTDDVLNKHNIKNKLHSDEINPAQMLIDYLKKFHGQEKIIKVSRVVVRKFLENLDLKTIIEKLEPDMRQFLKKDTAEVLIPKLITKIISSRHTVNFYRVLLNLVRAILDRPIFGRIILDNITAMMERYDSGGVLREKVHSLALSNEYLLSLILERGKDKLEMMIAAPEESYSLIRKKVEDYIHSPSFAELINDRKNILLEETDIGGWIYNTLEKYRRSGINEILNNIELLLNRLIESFCQNKDWQRKFNEITKKEADKLIEANHEQIRQKVKAALLAKDEDEIVKMVQDSAGDSAHAIRISGSLVGGLAGTVLYLVAMFVEGMLK
ncbi:MAG: DUF445 family protein [Selenomonadaceae bacterium]|nr:DUF445 family protein [Selenomonadaceae bacterium]